MLYSLHTISFTTDSTINVVYLETNNCGEEQDERNDGCNNVLLLFVLGKSHQNGHENRNNAENDRINLF